MYFHDTANLGADRAKIHQEEVLKLPFDDPKNMPDPERAIAAENKLVALMDVELTRANDLLKTEDDVLDQIDALVFAYYGLDAADIALIEDTFRYIIPAMQPRRSAGIQKIWKNSEFDERKLYALMLCDALAASFREHIGASLAACSDDVAVLRLAIGGDAEEYHEDSAEDLSDLLQSIAGSLPQSLPGNVQVMPDLRIVISRDMYLVKPLQLRHWLRSTALADAEQIAAEFSAAVARGARTEAAHAGR